VFLSGTSIAVAWDSHARSPLWQTDKSPEAPYHHDGRPLLPPDTSVRGTSCARPRALLANSWRGLSILRARAGGESNALLVADGPPGWRNAHCEVTFRTATCFTPSGGTGHTCAPLVAHGFGPSPDIAATAGSGRRVSSAVSGRSGALDLLRGFAVAGMLVVNNPGNWEHTFAPLAHSPWHGLTIADLIFPAFVFAMGAALALSLRRPQPGGWRTRVRRSVRRGLLLVSIGLLLNLAIAAPDVESVRVPGVLQRLGIVYTTAAVILATLRPALQWWIAGVLSALHTAVLLTGASLDPATNAAAAFDRRVFGSHMLMPAGDPKACSAF
jgi:hypothetical protein